MAPQSLANYITGRIMGFLYEHQRGGAGRHFRFNCRALEHYAEVERHVASLNDQRVFGFQNMSPEERMNAV